MNILHYTDTSDTPVIDNTEFTPSEIKHAYFILSTIFIGIGSLIILIVALILKGL